MKSGDIVEVMLVPKKGKYTYTDKVLKSIITNFEEKGELFGELGSNFKTHIDIQNVQIKVESMEIRKDGLYGNIRFLKDLDIEKPDIKIGVRGFGETKPNSEEIYKLKVISFDIID